MFPPKYTLGQKDFGMKQEINYSLLGNAGASHVQNFKPNKLPVRTTFSYTYTHIGIYIYIWSRCFKISNWTLSGFCFNISLRGTEGSRYQRCAKKDSRITNDMFEKFSEVRGKILHWV